MSRKTNRLRTLLQNERRYSSALEEQLKRFRGYVDGLAERWHMQAPQTAEFYASIPGAEMAGRVWHHNGYAGGDLAVPFVLLGEKDREWFENQEDPSLNTYIHLVPGEQSQLGVFIIDPRGHDPIDGAVAQMISHAVRATIAMRKSTLKDQDLVAALTMLKNNFYQGNVSSYPVTLFGGIVSPDSRDVLEGSYFLAGHPSPRIFRSNNDRFDPLDKRASSSEMIGVAPTRIDNPSEVNRFALYAGDSALAFSDGFYDHGKEYGRRYYPRHAEAVVRDHKERNVRDLSELISEDLATYAMASDDITHVVIKRT